MLIVQRKASDASASRFDTDANIWTLLEPRVGRLAPRSGHVMLLFFNQLAILGGYNGNKRFRKIVVYDIGMLLALVVLALALALVCPNAEQCNRDCLVGYGTVHGGKAPRDARHVFDGNLLGPCSWLAWFAIVLVRRHHHQPVALERSVFSRRSLAE